MQYFCVLFLCSFITLFCIGDDGYGAESVTAKANLQKLIKTNSCRGCDLSGLDFNRMDLSGVDLEGADLSSGKFYLTNLAGANLKNTKLRVKICSSIKIGIDYNL